MKALLAAVPLLIASVVAGSSPEPHRSYFRYVREIRVTAPERQNYVVLDQDVYQHSRPDLGDLRLYTGSNMVPYTILPQRRIWSAAGEDSEKGEILNVGRTGGATQLLVRSSSADAATPYDGIALQFRPETPDFVARVKVEGMYQTGGKPVEIGGATLFKLRRENLGENFIVHIRPAEFTRLRITVPGVAPDNVIGATFSRKRLDEFGWTALTLSPAVWQSGRKTVIAFDLSPNVPLARIAVTPRDINRQFWRPVQLQDEGGRVVASGDLHVIHRQSNRGLPESRNLELVFSASGSKHYELIIENGDDAPLEIAQVAAFARESRLYFDPRDSHVLRLYYGDSALPPPTYDYGILIRNARLGNGAAAERGPAQGNPEFAARPDARPWTERHPSVLWAALIIAVLGLATMALRGVKRT